MMTPGVSAVTPDLMVRNLTLVEPVHAKGNGHANGNERAAVLTSWKDIARYMGKGVRTVQRWEQDFGLPVRRPYGSNKKAILARPQDLDAWVAMRCHSRAAVEMLKAQPGDHPVGQVTQTLSALSAEVKTSRLLRESNQALMREIRAGLRELRASIVSLETKHRDFPHL